MRDFKFLTREIEFDGKIVGIFIFDMRVDIDNCVEIWSKDKLDEFKKCTIHSIDINGKCLICGEQPYTFSVE